MASPVASAALRSRIRRPSMLKKLCRPEDLLQHFPNGSYIGWSGFTGVGYPKSVLPDHPYNLPPPHSIYELYFTSHANK